MRVGVGRLVTVVKHGERRSKIDVVVRQVMHVAENGAADLHLGHARLLRAVRKSAGAAAAHDRDAVAGAAQASALRSERGDGVR